MKDYKIPKENVYLKSLVYQHAHIPNLALILCMDNAEGVCRWRFVNTLLEKCSKRCYSGRAEIEYCPVWLSHKYLTTNYNMSIIESHNGNWYSAYVSSRFVKF